MESLPMPSPWSTSSCEWERHILIPRRHPPGSLQCWCWEDRHLHHTRLHDGEDQNWRTFVKKLRKQRDLMVQTMVSIMPLLDGPVRKWVWLLLHGDIRFIVIVGATRGTEILTSIKLREPGNLEVMGVVKYKATSYKMWFDQNHNHSGQIIHTL